MKWKIKKYNKEYFEYTKLALETNDLMTQILLNRNINNKNDLYKFFNVNDRLLHNPFLFEDMKDTVNHLIKNKDKNIMIFGDYDIDGISGSIFLYKALVDIGYNVYIHIPNRSFKKLRLDDDFINKLKKYNIDTIITVDTSFTIIEDLEELLSNGYNIIITDHHKETFKKGYKKDNLYIINPKLSENYPFKELSGTGVAFKLAQAIYQRLNISRSNLEKYIDLMSLGIISDIVEVIDENRYLLTEGMNRLKNSNIKGLNKLMTNFKLNNKLELSITDISYNIIPLLNAICRMDEANKLVNFLLSDNDKEINDLINEMKIANKERKIIENNLFKKIDGIIKEKNKVKKLKYIYYREENLHLGVIGIIASKLSIKYDVPTIIASEEEGNVKASCRSFNNINIYDILKPIKKEFNNFGGHDKALGFVFNSNKMANIEEKIMKLMEKIDYKNIKEKEIIIDTKYSISSIDDKLIYNFRKLLPYGNGNPEPTLYDENIEIIVLENFGVSNRHFKGYAIKNSKKIEVIGYNLYNKLNLQKDKKLFKIIYVPELRMDNKIILRIKDIK